MNDLNYFDFYQLPQSLAIDEATLRALFLANSRHYHPDFFATAPPEAQAHALHMATWTCPSWMPY